MSTVGSDPTLTKAKITIVYAASDGFRSELSYAAGGGHPNWITGAATLPQDALLAALEELARLTALFGFEDEAMAVFNATM